MLICDKRRPRTRGDTNIRPPQGGRIKTAPPASGPRLGRSLAGGLHPQTPRAAPPGAPSRTGPLLPRSSSRRFRARVRPVAGVVNRLRLSTLDAQPLPLSLDSVFQKQGNRSVGKPQALSTGASVPAAAAVGRPRHRPQGGCPPWVGSGVVHGQSGFRAER